MYSIIVARAGPYGAPGSSFSPLTLSGSPSNLKLELDSISIMKVARMIATFAWISLPVTSAARENVDYFHTCAIFDMASLQSITCAVRECRLLPSCTFYTGNLSDAWSITKRRRAIM